MIEIIEIIRNTFKKEFGLIIVGAIIFTASFLWKDLLTDIEEYFFPKKYGLGGRIAYTVFVTIILVLIAIELKYMFGISSNTSIEIDDDDLDKDKNDDLSYIPFYMNQNTNDNDN